MKEAIFGVLGLIALPVIKTIINGLRKKESVSEIVADTLEAGVDAVDGKK